MLIYFNISLASKYFGDSRGQNSRLFEFDFNATNLKESSAHAPQPEWSFFYVKLDVSSYATSNSCLSSTYFETRSHEGQETCMFSQSC
jgi:hypothetical protein